MRDYTNKKADRKTNKTLYLIHCDLAGAIQLISINESKYPIIFLDNYSQLIVVYFLKNKSQAANATEKVLADMAPYSLVKRPTTDNEIEFTCSKFLNIFIKKKKYKKF